jgi:hypothetical protein
MLEKQSKNKFKNLLWDYYTTNREIGKQNDEYNRNNPDQGWNASAKIYLGVVLICVIAIIIKYFVL